MSKYKLVNWTGSMEVSDEQFRQTENYFISSIADIAEVSLTNYNYGLLPSRVGQNMYNGIRVNEHVTGRIEVQLYSCNAITASGFRIDFDVDRNGGQPLMKNYSPDDDKNIYNRNVTKWDIVLAVDPFGRTPVGEPDPNEAPPRHPHSESSYLLYVMPEGEINTREFGKHYLTIGRLRKDGDRFTVDTQYIPPCTSMASHGELADYYNIFGTLFSSMEKSSKNIIEKIHDRSNKSDLSVNIKILSEDVLRYIAGVYFNFRNKARYSAPVDTVGCVSSLAHRIYASLTILSSRHKEEMLKYFHEWTDVSPGSFEEMLADTLDIIYQHDNIRSMMVRSEQFLRTFTELWERLARLEYIGQHKESIVISERSQDNTSAIPKRKWSVTD